MASTNNADENDSTRAPTKASGRIDTHHHFVPTFYKKWLITNAHPTSGGAPIPDWSAQDSIDLMDNVGTSASILSISTPGVNLGNNDEARKMARLVNEFGAKTVQDHPDRFGFFATLTLPDIDGSLTEIDYAFDTLKADGVILLANSLGVYLGDVSFEPVMAELNRRNAVIFVHPNDLQLAPLPQIPTAAVDFLLDTTRAAISLVRAGCITRYPNLKIILSHAGGFLPYVAQRTQMVAGINHIPPNVWNDQIKSFYFDTAVSGSPFTLPSLLAFADPSKITFGSDFPWAPIEAVQSFTRALDSFPMTGSLRSMINHQNASAIFHRFQKGCSE